MECSGFHEHIHFQLRGQGNEFSLAKSGKGSMELRIKKLHAPQDVILGEEN